MGVNLDDRLMRDMFESKLEACEAEVDALSHYNQGFVKDMRRKYTNRERDTEFGAPKWNHTAKQYNHLTEIARSIGA